MPNSCKSIIKRLRHNGAITQAEYDKLMRKLDGWISVTERLPEEDDCYLVTTQWKGSYSGDVYTETNMAVYREKQKEWDRSNVIAWKPLPEPYKAESEVQDANSD